MKEIVASKEYGTPLMTQSAEIALAERVYVARIIGASVKVEDWRGATENEAFAHEKQLLNGNDYE